MLLGVRAHASPRCTKLFHPVTNMRAPKCRLCGKQHWSVFVTNAATNSTVPVESAISAVPNRTANRRTRKAYNAYMRDYMRKRRGKSAGQDVAGGEPGSVSGHAEGIDAEKAC